VFRKDNWWAARADRIFYLPGEPLVQRDAISGASKNVMLRAEERAARDHLA
jgi:hypothetical protein